MPLTGTRIINIAVIHIAVIHIAGICKTGPRVYTCSVSWCAKFAYTSRNKFNCPTSTTWAIHLKTSGRKKGGGRANVDDLLPGGVRPLTGRSETKKRRFRSSYWGPTPLPPPRPHCNIFCVSHVFTRDTDRGCPKSQFLLGRLGWMTPY